MAVNPQIATIIAAAYNKMAVVSLAIVRNFENGYGMSQKQQELQARLIKTTNIEGILARFVEFDDDGNYVAVHRLSDTTVNDLLKSLIKVADLDTYPVAPRIFYRNYPNIISGSGGGGSIGTLGNGQLYVGDVNNIAVARTPGGVISMSNTGVFSFTAGAIVNADVNASAGIVYSKLNLTGGIVNADVNASAGIVYSKLNLAASIVNADIAAGAAITRTKIANGTANRVLINDASGIFSENAAITANRAIVSSAAGLPTASATTDAQVAFLSDTTGLIQAQINGKQATITGAATTVVTSNLTFSRAVVSGTGGKIEVHPNTTLTEIGFVNGVTSPIQTQLNARLSVTLTSPAQGDIIYFNGTAWVNLPRGTNGQALYSTATSIQWNTPTINGIPIGGSTRQVLAKTSGVDFASDWTTLVLTDISNVTASAAEVNVLQGLTATTTQLNFVTGATSNLQIQLDDKLSKSLAQNAMFVGNSSGIAVALSSGTTGYVLTSVSGVPTWQPSSAGTPPGATTQVIFNDAGAFGADAGMVYNKTTNVLTIDTSLILSGRASNLLIGSNNTVISGGGNVLLGISTGTNLTTGTSNTGIGSNTLDIVSGGVNNTAVGRYALTGTTGNNNIAVGAQAGDALTSGSGNLIIGYNIDAQSNTGSNQLTIQNIIFGTNNSGTGTTVSTGNIGIGVAAPAARLHVLQTTEQLRLGYDAAIYCSVEVDSAGRVNLTSVGGAAQFFQFQDNTVVNANLSVGASFAPEAIIHSRGITEQLRLGYDAANYTSFTVGSTGGLTITPGAISGNLSIGGSFSLPYRAITSASTASATDFTIDCTSGTFTLNLPTAVGIPGRLYSIRNSGAGVITIDPNAAETLDGGATQTLTASQRYLIISTGANWISIAN